jgi:hypothetical protein
MQTRGLKHFNKNSVHAGLPPPMTRRCLLTPCCPRFRIDVRRRVSFCQLNVNSKMSNNPENPIVSLHPAYSLTMDWLPLAPPSWREKSSAEILLLSRLGRWAPHSFAILNANVRTVIWSRAEIAAWAWLLR